MKTSMLVSMTVAAASVAMADVVLPDTSTVADMQAAIDSAQSGEVITLADGTYVLDQTLYVTNGVTLTGSGRDACILAGDDSKPLETALVIDHADACVKMLTISNITTTTWYNYTGVGAQIKSGLLTQARVTACKAPAGGRTAGVTLEGSDAVMTQCMIDHNEGTGGNNLGGVRIMGGGGTMANCLVWANAGVNAGGVSLKPNPWAPEKVVAAASRTNQTTLGPATCSTVLWSSIQSLRATPHRAVQISISASATKQVGTRPSSTACVRRRNTVSIHRQAIRSSSPPERETSTCSQAPPLAMPVISIWPRLFLGLTISRGCLISTGLTVFWRSMSISAAPSSIPA